MNGTKVSFYAGTRFTDNTKEVIVAENGTKATTTPVKKAPDYYNVTIDGKTYDNVINVIEVASQVYYIKHNTEWSGVETSEAVKGGKFYGVYSEAYESNTPTSYGPTTATTTLSPSEVELNATGVTVTTGGFTATTTAVGTQFYVQHFIKKSTDSQYTFLATSPKITATTDEFVTDISDYAKSAGTYEIKTVLTDGKVYYVVDTDTITVVEKFNVTVESTSNANLVVKNGSTPLGTINAGADAQTFRVVKGDSISVTATPTDNTGVYDFLWSWTGKTISKDEYKATSTQTETINNDAEISVTVNNHCYKLTYSGVTATPESDERGYIPADTEVTLTFKDSTNHNKVVWSVNSTQVKTTDVVEKGSEDTYTVKMDADKTVSVSKTTLYKLTYSLKSDSVENSSVSAKVGTTQLSADTDYYYPKDTVVSLTATKPDTDNYYLVTWYDSPGGAAGGESPGGINKDNPETKDYTISADIAITVSITKIQTYAVKINKPTNASLVATYEIDAHTGTFENINTSGATVNLPEGATVKVTATALTGYQFESYTVKTGNTTDTKTDSELTVTVGTQPIEITVNTSAAENNVVYLRNTANWKTKKAYWWLGSENNNWPGQDMTLVSGNVYRVEIPTKYTSVIFNQGSNDNQSATLEIKDGYIYDNEAKTWTEYTSVTEYTVTVASVENAEVKVTYGSNTITEGNSASVPENTEITVTVTPNTSYNVTSIKVGSSTTTYTTSGPQTKTAIVTDTVTVSAEVKKTITVYFEDTLNWGQAYVNFYSGSYWNTNNGTGSKNITSAANQMTRIAGTNIYQFTYSGSYSSYISFTKDSQPDYENFYNTSVVYRSDFSVEKPFFIPDTTTTGTYYSSSYFNNGVWSAYPNTTVSSSYYLRGDFNSWETLNKMVKPSSDSNLVETTISLGAGTSYEFKINTGDKWYTNADVTITNSSYNTYIDFSNTAGDAGNCKIKVDSAGKYKFIFNTSEKRLTVVKIPD